MSDVVLVFAVLIFAYPFLLYPILLTFLVPKYRTPSLADQPKELPSTAVVICALNEQEIIRQKLENCLSLDYPREKLKIVVVSDGSTDATAAIVREYAPHGIELIERAERRGKAANLGEVVSALGEEIVVFSDANVLYDRLALRHLVARFQDPTVGCVSGRVVLVNTTESLKASEQDYYSIEWRLQERSSALYSMPGADGAMYAVRRELFVSCPDDTLIEDFIISMAVVRQGKRVVFEPRAVGWENGPRSLQEEFLRKVRISAGAAQALVRGNAWPIGAPLRFWFTFVSHKLLRWLSPLLGLLILIVAGTSWTRPLAQVTLAGFFALIALALLRLLTRWAHPICNGPFYFLFGQLALTLGLLKGATGAQSVLWAKADR